MYFNHIQFQLELYRRLQGLVEEGLLSCILQREEVRQENAIWVSIQLEFAKRKEAMEVEDLEKQMGKLKGPGEGVGFMGECEVGDEQVDGAEGGDGGKPGWAEEG